MFGIKFIKVDPTVYLLQYKNGKLVREGIGLSFFYFAPTTSLVAVPIASTDVPFIFKEVTADYQEITVQGQVAFRVADPKRLAQMLDFTIDPIRPRINSFDSEDHDQLPQRIVNLVQVLVRKELETVKLREVLRTSDNLVQRVRLALSNAEVLKSLGVEILDLSILAVKPNPETARALEAEIREDLLKDADEAIYARRNSAVEQERAIKENELNTEIAVENKRRQIREAQMDAERSVQEKQRLIREEEMVGRITIEEKNKELVTLSVGNQKLEADAKAYSLGVVMDTFKKVDPKVINSLASMNMQPNQLIALSFKELAESAGKIGELNISPDLLRELAKAGK
jgi:hypothetical protein